MHKNTHLLTSLPPSIQQGLCKAPVGVSSGVHILVIAVVVFSILLSASCFIKMISELCFENQIGGIDNDDDEHTKMRFGSSSTYKSFS